MSEQPYFTIYGEGWNYESNTNGTWVDRESFDTLTQRLQVAERLLRCAIQYEHGPTLDAMIDAFLSGKGGKA